MTPPDSDREGSKGSSQTRGLYVPLMHILFVRRWYHGWLRDACAAGHFRGVLLHFGNRAAVPLA